MGKQLVWLKSYLLSSLSQIWTNLNFDASVFDSCHMFANGMDSTIVFVTKWPEITFKGRYDQTNRWLNKAKPFLATKLKNANSKIVSWNEFLHQSTKWSWHLSRVIAGIPVTKMSNKKCKNLSLPDTKLGEGKNHEKSVVHMRYEKRGLCLWGVLK